MTRPSAAAPSLLALNCGSRTLKAALFRSDEGAAPRLVLSALAEASANNSDSRLAITDASGASLLDAPIASGKSGDSGVQALLDWLDSNGHTSSLLAAGHRIVHGGPHCVR
jgi:acetate kinase